MVNGMCTRARQGGVELQISPTKAPILEWRRRPVQRLVGERRRRNHRAVGFARLRRGRSGLGDLDKDGSLEVVINHLDKRRSLPKNFVTKKELAFDSVRRSDRESRWRSGHVCTSVWVAAISPARFRRDRASSRRMTRAGMGGVSNHTSDQRIEVQCGPAGTERRFPAARRPDSRDHPRNRNTGKEKPLS
jgi:hypothetical protein